MLRKKPTISIYFNRRYTKKSGLHPVSLRITATWMKPRQKYFGLNIDLSADEWDRIQGNPKGRLLAIKQKIESQKADAYRIVEELPYYTHSAFEDKFVDDSVYEIEVYDVFEEKVKELKELGKMSTHAGYKATLSSLRLYRKNKPIYFVEVDVDFLKSYYLFLSNSGKSDATVRTYFRYFQHIFNIAIQDGLIPKEHFPFISRHLKLPKGNKAKKALKEDTIRAIIGYSSSDKDRQMARDLWVFSYSIGGANMPDIARLTKGNIKNGAIFYYRGKTVDKKTVDEPAIAKLNDAAKSILNRYSGDGYLFPIYKQGLTPEQRYNRHKRYVKSVNTAFKAISEELDVERITFGSARSSFATRWNKLGISRDVISLKMGHSKSSEMGDWYITEDVERFGDAFDKLIEF